MVREGADELTLRADEEGALCTFNDTTNVGGKKDGGHRSCMRTGTPSARPFSKSRRTRVGSHVLSHKAAKCKKTLENKRAQALWSLKEAKDKGTDFHDLGRVQKIQTRSQVRLALWAIHLKSPTAALANALEQTEQNNGLAQRTATSEL